MLIHYIICCTTPLWRCLWLLCSEGDNAKCDRRDENQGCVILQKCSLHTWCLTSCTCATTPLFLNTCWLPLCSKKEVLASSDKLNSQAELRREIMAHPTADHLENSLLLPSRHGSALAQKWEIKPAFMVPKDTTLSSTGTCFWSVPVPV